MFHLVLDVQSTLHTDDYKKLKAWVNVNSHNEALAILCEQLSLQGWAMTNVIESVATEESDYFEPCEALDAYNEARQNLLALRFY